jgi:hypothetical protein
MDLQAKTNVSIQARVFRIAWDRKPFFIPKGLWMALGRRRIPGTGRWENLGTIATSENGTAGIARA